MPIKIARRKAKPQPDKTKTSTSRDKVRAYRARVRAKGMRQITFWVPDTRTPQFRANAHRQSLAAANSSHAHEEQTFVDAISEWNEA